MDLKLVRPSMDYMDSALEFKAEFFKYGEKIINGSAMLDQLEYDEWLERLENGFEDFVPSSVFFGVVEGRIVGIIDIRHNLDNEFLKAYAGHIGYSIRPSERNKGYATSMLLKGLEKGRSLGLSEVMLGCYESNLASRRVIEKAGGLLTEKKKYIDGRDLTIYWIDL